MHKFGILLTRIVLLGGLLSATGSVAQQAPPAPRFHHVHLNTTDPRQAIEFYTSHFTGRKQQFTDLTDGIWTGDSWILFTHVATPPPTELISTVQHIGWGAKDMATAYRKQLDRGTAFHTPMRDISHMVIDSYKPFLFAYVSGPDGIMIEMNSSRNDDFGHIHLSSLDPEAAGEWYKNNLGLKVAEKFRSSPIPSVDLVADQVSWLIAPTTNLKNTSPDWKGRTEFVSTLGRIVDHVAFSVDDLDAAVNRMRRNGVKIIAEPRNVVSGKLRSAFIEGPDHIAIELIEDRTPAPAPLVK